MMTSTTISDLKERKPAIRSGAAVAFVAREEVIAALRASPDLGLLGALECHVAGLADPVADGWVAGAAAVVIEVAGDNPASLARVERLRQQNPRLPVIAALGSTDIALARALLRQGVSDIASLPVEPAELAGQLAELASGKSGAAAAAPLAPLVVVAGGTGGCGATTVLTHLAAALTARRTDAGRLCVIDLDLQAGEVAYYLGQVPRVTVSALLDAGDRLDAELLQSALTDSGHGFSILAAPETITPLDNVDEDRLLELLRVVRGTFDMVLVDLPTDWSNWSLSLALAADRMVLVTELSVAGLRQTRRRLDLFASLGVRADRIRIVANRVEHGLFRSIDLKDASAALGCEVAATIVDEDGDMAEAQNEGRLLTDLHRHSRFAGDIERLAKLLDLEGR